VSRPEPRVADPWGPRTPYGPSGPDAEVDWPERVDCWMKDGLAVEAADRWVQSASVLHSNGDAMDFAVKDDRIVGVRGRPGDRVNRGRLGPKDLFGWQAIGSPDRLTRPLIREDGHLVETDWDTAMARIVERSKDLLAQPGGWGKIGFYTSGQLFLEEYYTLGVIGKAGIGTPHMDGNTRLCTATAGAALKASFGCDGQPGSYADLDVCDSIALWGHNMAETQDVTWSRILDRRAGPNPPRLLAVDPRSTSVTREADVHLAIRGGTNLTLMNGLLHLIIGQGWFDPEWVAAHTIGFDDLEKVVAAYEPARVAETCAIDVADLWRAAELLGTGERLVSTVLQGFYQSHQATASACQVNNLHLLRGMIGRPGAGVLQMNGQPSAQNTRESGADGDLPGFRNWDNPEHIRELAKLWNVEEIVIPHWAPPTHAMQIFRYAEQGTIELLWISGTNPAVSLPELRRIREILTQERLFVVVQDLFLTETAALADVVLPAATAGEKMGTFTNADRTVHLSEKAVEPPGEARADLDIFLDYARRMDFRDRDDGPLITWTDPESAFEAWKACSGGRPCDYGALTYEKLRGPSGIQWPCTPEAPDGTDRLYTDAVFPTDADVCETYGNDLLTGAPHTAQDRRALQPGGRALLLAAEATPPPEAPTDELPFTLTTGRTVYHFHTRTKTGRAPELNAAAPDVWVELHVADAERAGISEGDRVRVVSTRGCIEGPVRLSGIRPGMVFVPFHYGNTDARPGQATRAANELTQSRWDPVSKQPMFKVAAVRVERIGPGTGPAPAPAIGGSAPVATGKEP
jgi:ferredoxin-nitrate reductase